MPGPLDSGTWHPNLTLRAVLGPNLLRRLRGMNLAWLWANRMRVLVVLATAAGALSLTGAGPFPGFLRHTCSEGDCAGACAVQPSCAHMHISEPQSEQHGSVAAGIIRQKVPIIDQLRYEPADTVISTVSSGDASSLGQGTHGSGTRSIGSGSPHDISTEAGVVKPKPQAVNTQGSLNHSHSASGVSGAKGSYIHDIVARGEEVAKGAQHSTAMLNRLWGNGTMQEELRLKRLWGSNKTADADTVPVRPLPEHAPLGGMCRNSC